MPLTLTSVTHGNTCQGHRVNIDDYSLLVEYIAHVTTGSFLHVERIINDLQSAGPNHIPTAAKQARERLGVPGNDTQRYHRDGWVFQIISWIAAHISKPGEYLSAAPHCRMADKGFDGILIPIGSSEETVEAIIICEDKATENPRTTVTGKVWPEIVSLEKGERDAEIISEVTNLLRRRLDDESVEKAIQGIYLDESRQYRVCITLPTSCATNSTRESVFVGYDEKAPGDINKRYADSLELDNLRDWMDQLCQDCIVMIDKTHVPIEGGE